MSEYGTRVERDVLGEVVIPAHALWGAGTQRAVDNFTISGQRFPAEFIRHIALIKWAAAQVNRDLGRLDHQVAAAIEAAAEEILSGSWADQFPIDVFQTGSGTSTNMNVNEVIAALANERLGAKRGDKRPVHANDHVNLGQSSNDVIPSAMHISASSAITLRLIPELDRLAGALAKKARDFDRILKIGRTHLQDATPIRLGQEFGGYAHMVESGRAHVQRVLPGLAELALGGTAVGTGINTHPRFACMAIELINRRTGLRFHEARNHFAAQGGKDACVEMAGALKAVAASLFKIANDIRWLGCGPRNGLGELILPEVQPGSSIMPGKVNPVMAECLIQTCLQVIGADAVITQAGLGGQFELNAMMPVMAFNLFNAITWLANAVAGFTGKCVEGLQANEKACRDQVEKSLAMCTALTPHIGYDAAAALARDAYAQGVTVRELAMTRRLLPPDQLDKVLDPWSMTENKERA